MSNNQRILIISLIVLLIFIIVLMLRKGKFTTKYSLVWLFSTFIMIIFMIFPNILEFFSNLIGFQVQSNFVFSIFIVLLLFISMSLTIIVSGQKQKINKLIQEVSILKGKVEK